MTTAYYEPGSTVDVTIRGARISDRHIQDRRLFLMLPDGGDVHVPLPLPASVTVTPPPDASDRALRDNLTQLLNDWVIGADDFAQGADAILNLVARAIDCQADVEYEYRDSTNYLAGWLDAASFVRSQAVSEQSIVAEGQASIVHAEAASPLSDEATASSIVQPEAASGVNDV